MANPEPVVRLFDKDAGGPDGRRKLDRIDRAILHLLQADARIANKEIARRVNLSPTPCLRRVRLLEEAGYIQRYKTVLDPNQLGYAIRAFLGIKRSRNSSRTSVADEVLKIPEVLACHVVSGEFDLLVEIVARDMEHYSEIALEHIAEMDSVLDLRSTFSIKTLKTDGPLPMC
ncbi:Lrp/AsnC family transcriptional regulator [Sulfitobacter sp. F26204]|uniref:Lrp/AsnC family transcriptional regulator n=1 Tax=Sulfitobacter sp. F26204 TaxID=2996014 RepID=UPI00225DEE7B|nr:Lrp/AsnC family transcriptional regulator [Sulfitobacter sp. F26204]MCX7561451.1 Lrp/AsnC family transcriptional regulator [Sulfitobacter sp. F26204]